jgi:hypothetical protein
VGSIVLHPDTHVMRRVRVPKFDRQDATHERIASLSKGAHEAVKVGQLGRLQKLESELALTCGKLWGIGTSDVAAIEQCLAQILE